MRLILVLLVLIYVSIVYAGDYTSCKQLCSDKKSCCSAPLNNQYYLKSNMECSNCGNQKYFAISDNFGIGSTVTICNLNKGELYGVDQLGFFSSIASSITSAASSAASSVTSAASSAASSVTSVASSATTSVTSAVTSYDSESNNVSNNKNYKGGEGKFGDEQLGFFSSIASSITSAASSAASSVTSAASSAASSVTSAASSATTSVSSAVSSVTSYDSESAKFAADNKYYKGGEGKLNPPKQTDERIIIGKCIKVSTVAFEQQQQQLDKPIINVSKQVCKDLLGESCDSEEEIITSVVQSTKNDGFANEGVFEVTRNEYNLIIKHGKIFRNHCELKGKCQFNRA